MIVIVTAFTKIFLFQLVFTVLVFTLSTLLHSVLRLYLNNNGSVCTFEGFRTEARADRSESRVSRKAVLSRPDGEMSSCVVFGGRGKANTVSSCELMSGAWLQWLPLSQFKS